MRRTCGDGTAPRRETTYYLLQTIYYILLTAYYLLLLLTTYYLLLTTYYLLLTCGGGTASRSKGGSFRQASSRSTVFRIAASASGLGWGGPGQG